MLGQSKLDTYAKVINQVKSFSDVEKNIQIRKQHLCKVLSENFKQSMTFVGFYDIKYHQALKTQCLNIGAFTSQTVHPCPVIEIGNGVCGTAVLSRKTQNVEDVTKIQNYIACDEQTKSEIVVPVFDSKHILESSKVISVLDIDGSSVGFFDGDDDQNLATLLDIVFYS